MAVEPVVVAAAAGRSYYATAAAADRTYYASRTTRAVQRPLGKTVWRGWVAGWPCCEWVGYGGRVASWRAGRWVKGYRASVPPPLFST